MSNNLTEAKQVAVVSALTEGCSIRSIERMVGVSQPTILSLLVRVGEGCEQLHNDVMRGLSLNRIECDEIWAFVQRKARNVYEDDADAAVVGDTWTYVALDADTKLIPSYLIGKRTAQNTNAFVADLRSRVTGRVQISTDGLALYVNAIEGAFGSQVDYGTVVKQFEGEFVGPGRYSPPSVTGIEKRAVIGSPDEATISTSYVERQNLQMRMSIRRMTRLTNAFSKKLRNHRAANALHFAAYNFTRTHGTLRTTPAMAAGVTKTAWSIADLLDAALHGVR